MIHVNMRPSIEKKIVLILPTLEGGGAEKVMLTLAQVFSSWEDDRVVVAVFNGKGVYKDRLPRGVRYVDFDVRRARYALPSLWLLLYREKPDIVITTMQSTIIYFLTHFFLSKRSLWIARLENPYSSDITSLFPVARWIFTKALATATWVVALGSGMREDLLQHTSIDARRVVVIPNPITAPRARGITTSVALEHPAVLMCGRLVAQKNYEYALAVFAALRRILPSAHLYILGEGELKKHLQTNVVEQKLEKQVHFLGFQNNPHAYMFQADVFLLTSHYEGFGNVLVEALACGLPVVSVDCPTGPRDVLEKCTTATLVPVGILETTVKALVKYITLNQTERFDIQKKSQVYATHFTPETIASRYRALWDV